MSGIKNIANRREQEKSAQSSGGLELWLKDGDQASVALVATGEEDDNKLGDVYTHTIQSIGDAGRRNFNTIVCGRTFDEDCDECVNGKSQHQFAVWAYVYSIAHAKNESKNAEWEVTENRMGDTIYKETVEDYRIFRRGFGRGDSLWEQVVGIYNDVGALNKNVIRISRKGTTMQDTSYTIAATSTKVKLPDSAVEAGKELLGIVDFYRQKAKVQVAEAKPSTPDAESDLSNDESGTDDTIF